MLKILSAVQIREADAFTIKNEPISSIDLMERAAVAFVNKFIQMYHANEGVIVVCGTGNNGGDGLAISRLLIEKGFAVTTYVVGGRENRSSDFEANYERLLKQATIVKIKSRIDSFILKSDCILIDAIFGSGLSRPITGIYAGVIDKMNGAGTPMIAVDIASGLYCDKPAEGDVIIKPTTTITFQMPKLVFMMPAYHKYVGKLEVVDIGLDKRFLEKAESAYRYVEQIDVSAYLKKRSKFSHKGDYGKVLLVAGSYGKMGAVILSSSACMRMGTGLLTAHVPKCGYEIMQVATPETMVVVDKKQKYISDFPKDVEKYDAIAIGPGLDTKQQSIEALTAFLEAYDKPIVMDADGINMLGLKKARLRKLPKNSILTPHVKEFQRIAGDWKNDFERLTLQSEFSKRHEVFVVLKGAHTTISTPEGKLIFNSTGNPGMATAGSGDVLTGMIVSLLGQGFSSEQAVICGVYLHGLAGDLAAEVKTEHSLIASDIVDFIPLAYKKIIT